MFRCWPWICCLVAVLPCASLAAQWIDEPVALGWSAEEVERASAGQVLALAGRAEQDGLQGCVAHCARLQQVFERLQGAARTQSGRAQALPWSLTVLRLADVEAMALPGGQVLISEVFIDQRQLSDEALAFVLAHEMAHSILEHERQALSFARLLLPRHVQRSVRDMYTEMEFNFGLLRGMEPVLHQTEIEADEVGLLLASAAGYAPELQLGFIDAEARLPDRSPGLLPTHPSARSRLQRLRLRLPLAQRVFLQQQSGAVPAYPATQPPHTGKTWPTKQAAASLAR